MYHFSPAVLYAATTADSNEQDDRRSCGGECGDNCFVMEHVEKWAEIAHLCAKLVWFAEIRSLLAFLGRPLAKRNI